MTDPVVVGYANNKIVFSSDVKMKSLYTQGGANSSSRDEDGNKYQVPADKKFILLQVSYMRTTTNVSTGLVYIQPTQDSGVGATLALSVSAAANEPVVLPCYVEVSTGNYVGQGSMTDLSWQGFGAEVDA